MRFGSGVGVVFWCCLKMCLVVVVVVVVAVLVVCFSGLGAMLKGSVGYYLICRSAASYNRSTS